MSADEDGSQGHYNDLYLYARHVQEDVVYIIKLLKVWRIILFSKILRVYRYISGLFIKIRRHFLKKHPVIRGIILRLLRCPYVFIKTCKNILEKPVIRGIILHLINYPHEEQESFNNGESKKPHFLILRYKHSYADPDIGDAQEKLSIDNCLSATQLATYDTFYWEDCPLFPKGDWKLLNTCRAVRPDAIILSLYSPQNYKQPSVETIRILRKDWGIPIIAIWWDTCYNGFWESIQPILSYVDVNVVMDNPLLNFLDKNKGGPYYKRFLPLWTPYDPLIYFNEGCTRDINVSFLGQVGGYRSYRMQYIQHLRRNNLPIYCSPVSQTKQLHRNKYVEILKKSKIVLNFSYSMDSHQLKGRVFEAILCGAMLLESENPQIRCYFTPGKDYVSFDSEDDLVDKIKYFLEHEDERLEIAARGELKVRKYYNHTEFWKKVIIKLKEVQELTL